LARNRAARQHASLTGPIGALHTTSIWPAEKHAERWPVWLSSSGDDRQVSAKSSFSV
jgi:hypothetical protein